LGGPLRLEKGPVWILDASANEVGAAHYLPPLRRKRPEARHRPRTAQAG
jgi:hypothetical protein